MIQKLSFLTAALLLASQVQAGTPHFINETESNDSFATAQDLGVLQSNNDYFVIGQTDYQDPDFFKFTYNGGYNLWLGNVAGLDDTFVRLSNVNDPSHAVIGPTFANNFQLTYLNLQPGTYSVEIASFSWTPQTSYTLALSPVAAVPEPETYAMMLSGLGLMGLIAKRRKQGN